jgi:starch synthase
MALKTRRSRTPRKFRIVYAVAETFPFVKVGGSADMAGALPKALARLLGHDVCVMLPKYAQIDEQ